MKRIVSLCAVVISLLITSSLNATDYVFTGNGLWTDPANWENGLMPKIGSGLTSGNTITIKGTTATAQECPGDGFCSNPIYLSTNSGTITIAAGGSLTVPNGTQFGNIGSLIVYGTLITQTEFQVHSTGSISIFGTVIIRKRNIGNQGLITINSGGTLISEAVLDNDMNFGVQKGTIILNSGGIIDTKTGTISRLGKVINNGGIINNAASLTGNATITGSLDNSGTLAPGNSPGIYNVTGDYTATSTAIHTFEVAGNTSALYDQLAVGGTANLSGTLNVSLLSGYVPKTTDNIPIITGTINGTFSSVNIPSQYVLVYKANSVNLVGPSVLPVTFLSLDAKKENTSTKLSWNVASEAAVLRYEVEKSSDGRSFNYVGSVTASGLSQYSFTDATAEGKTFYRIKSVDKDGRFNYSIVINFVNNFSVVAFKVFQNAAHNCLAVQHPASGKGSNITITSMDGRLIKSVITKEGASQTTIDITSLKAGAYVLRLNDGKGNMETAKFIK